MNRKYYFNNMWWGWVTGGYMLYMSWIMIFKYRLLFWCISLRNGFVSGCKWYIEDTALKFCSLISGTAVFLLIHLEKWDCLLFIRVLFSYLSLPLSMIYILSVIIKGCL